MKKLPKASVEHSFTYQGTETFFEALPLAALLVDAATRVVAANPAADSIIPVLRSPIRELLDEAHPICRAIAQAINHERTTHLREVMVMASVFNIWVAPLSTSEALVLVDALPPKAQNHYTELSATMAAMLAHEIRNPLLAIKGAAQLLTSAVTQEDQTLCTLIIKEVDRLEQLIATLDPLSTAPAKQSIALNIHEVLEHARQAIAAAFPAITFVLDYDPSLPDINGDRSALVQALLNLVKNAAEAVIPHAQPTITISTRYVMGESRRNTEGKNLPVAITIADNGSGIDPVLRDRLFAPFTTSKTGGKGLGLAVVARIAEEHKGLVVHEPSLNGGARFTLYLPTA